MYIPLHLSAPEYVFLLVHVDGEVLVLALLDGVRPGGDGPHFSKLVEKKWNKETLVNLFFYSYKTRYNFIKGTWRLLYRVKIRKWGTCERNVMSNDLKISCFTENNYNTFLYVFLFFVIQFMC